MWTSVDPWWPFLYPKDKNHEVQFAELRMSPFAQGASARTGGSAGCRGE